MFLFPKTSRFVREGSRSLRHLRRFSYFESVTVLSTKLLQFGEAKRQSVYKTLSEPLGRVASAYLRTVYLAVDVIMNFDRHHQVFSPLYFSCRGTQDGTGTYAAEVVAQTQRGDLKCQHDE